MQVASFLSVASIASTIAHTFLCPGEIAKWRGKGDDKNHHITGTLPQRHPSLNYIKYRNNRAKSGNIRRQQLLKAKSRLRRRSQRSRMTWERFQPFIALYIPKVRTLNPYPNQPFAP